MPACDECGRDVSAGIASEPQIETQGGQKRFGKQVVGVCGVNRRVAVHRSAPLGRISVLVVAEEAQGRGIGRMLVEAAEAWFRKQGCTLVEVTSNDRRTQAHAFYRHMGYERTSIRFAKTL